MIKKVFSEKRVKIFLVFTRCGSYRGNGICKKYVQNVIIYFTDKERQQQMEKTIELSLGMISEECRRFGVPAICYHLFPVCFHGEKKSRLCQDECHKIQTDVCKNEMSKMLKFISEELLFPDCSSLPKSNTSFGDHCVQLGIHKKIVNETKKSIVKTQYGELILKYRIWFLSSKLSFQ